ncbi:hypothetical protein HPB48_005849 [Haemaphysalis longicornis]|uniref:Uncharacterized protein n=1 Tax=Haemaphysalis longicornis TaxID=44386 RepID=A0A9J6GDY5_HAELO|nr:hypothetical protein HPB48_005849 [Haemaphysalis longicornis]
MRSAGGPARGNKTQQGIERESTGAEDSSQSRCFRRCSQARQRGEGGEGLRCGGRLKPKSARQIRPYTHTCSLLDRAYKGELIRSIQSGDHGATADRRIAASASFATSFPRGRFSSL